MTTLALPAEWTATAPGQLAWSPRPGKRSPQSLAWTWAAGAPLVRRGLALDPEAQPATGMEGWIHCEQPLAGRLEFRLGTAAGLAAGRPGYVLRFTLGFTGWRMFRVRFARDCRVAGGAIAELQIIPPAETPAGSIAIEPFTIAASVSPQRSADFQVPEHAGGLGGWCEHWPLHYARQQPTEPLPAAITPGQVQDCARIADRYRKWLFGDQPDLTRPLLAAGAEQFQEYMRRGWRELAALGLVRDAAGRIVGPGLVKDFGSPTSFKHVFYDILMPLVCDYRVNGSMAARDTALELFYYLHDQGWAEGSALGDLWLNCLGFAPYCHAIALMRDDLAATGRLDRAVRAALWYLTFGKSFGRFGEAYQETNADALRSVVFTALVIILSMDDTPRKVQYLRGWRAWYHDALQVSPRFTGLIKPDGLGFHHEGVYAGAYATCAYEFTTLIAWLLHGTEFAAAPEVLANLKLALTTQDTLTADYEIPYPVMGRMPRPGVRLFAAYAYLALASDPPDADLAGILMRLWRPELPGLQGVLSVDLDAQGGKFLFLQPFGRLQLLQELADRALPAAPRPEGFFSKPWGALALHRRGDWLLALKGWSQYVWDFEMHPKSWAPKAEENVFARYWSYGTLQPLTHGDPIHPVASGWNLAAGWDWTRWPGATTPHLPLADLYDPQTSWACRFFSAATFVGAVSSAGRHGMFALKLHEHYYDPTFRAYKTYCCFDDQVICLGSNIATRDDRYPTETTLFQCWLPDETMPLWRDGEAITAFPCELAGRPGAPVCLRDPYGHGYYLPDGRQLRLTRAIQHSRDAWNKGDTSGPYATAWLDHGHAPRDDGYGEVRYHYVLLVHSTPERLAAYAAAPPYRVHQ